MHRLSLVAASWGLLVLGVRGLLTAEYSLQGAQRLQRMSSRGSWALERRLSNCGPWA